MFAVRLLRLHCCVHTITYFCAGKENHHIVYNSDQIFQLGDFLAPGAGECKVNRESKHYSAPT